MIRKHEKTFALVALCVLVLMFSGCSSYMVREAKGIPVKDFKPTAEEAAAAEKQRQIEEKEIKAFSGVTRNSVFSEESGTPEYLIGPGDVLQITYWEGAKHSEYTTQVRADGKISYSFVDDLPVAGRSLTQVHTDLTAGLKNYIRNPRFEIVVKEYRSKSALLFGMINKIPPGPSGPGKYYLKGKTSVLDFIVSAGGPITGRGGGTTGASRNQVVVTDEAGGNADLRNVELVRRGKRYTLNLYDIMFKGDMSQNIIVDNGDVISVPELPVFGERVYVLGEVASQGLYRLKDASDLLGALAISGGPTRLAVKSDIKIIRDYQEGKGKPIILSASYDGITKQGDISQNIVLKDGDVVWVPRILIGDINEWIVNSIPLLDYMFYPSRFRDAYGSPDQMRIK